MKYYIYTKDNYKQISEMNAKLLLALKKAQVWHCEKEIVVLKVDVWSKKNEVRAVAKETFRDKRSDTRRSERTGRRTRNCKVLYQR